jgi:hypothetical protein
VTALPHIIDAVCTDGTATEQRMRHRVAGRAARVTSLPRERDVDAECTDGGAIEKRQRQV